MRIAKIVIITVVITFCTLLVVPMISLQEINSGCDDSRPISASVDINCAPAKTYKIVFPVYRTVVCSMYHKSGCATDTLYAGWRDSLMNAANVMIVLSIVSVSVFIGFRATRKRDK